MVNIIKTAFSVCYKKHPFLHRKRIIRGKLRIVTNIRMSTLSNVNSRQSGLNLSDDRVKSIIIPEIEEPSDCKVISDGVSSNYAQMDGCQWYVLRATYNRVEKSLNALKAKMTYIYLPKRFTLKQIGAKKKRQWEPLLPNMVFVYSSQDVIERTFLENRELAHYRFYRDKTQQINGYDGKHPPIVVPYNEMMNFIRLTSVENEHIRLVTPEHCHYKSGDRVRIIDGDFIDVEGRVARIAGQQRVVVEMRGICLVATAYIPSAFLEKIT